MLWPDGEGDKIGAYSKVCVYGVAITALRAKSDMDSRIQQIIERLNKYTGVYPRDEINAALEIREEITPHLIGILEKILGDPAAYLRGDHHAHIYAAVLLAYIQEPRAHDVIVDVFSLPDDVSSELFGDMVTETLPALLYRTCNGSLARIKELVLNKSAYEFCRISAIDAMVFAVTEGVTTREDALTFFGALFTGTEAEPASYFWGGLASAVCDLYPEGMMDVIGRAYEDGLIDTGYISQGEFKQALVMGKEAAIKEVRRQAQQQMPDDIHRYVEWWAMLDERKRMPVPTAIAPSSNPKKNKAKTKNKRKAEKSSRRKNRRR